MPSRQTQNYHLNQWEPEDKVLRTDFNTDNEKIDDALAGKADVSALAALSQRVDGKADAAAQTELSKTVSSHTAALNKKGNCVIHIQTYKGTGASGPDNPTVIKFPGKPLYVVVYNHRGKIEAGWGMTLPMHAEGASIIATSVTWTENSMSIYSTSTSNQQMNNLNGDYTVIALLAADA